MTFSCTCPNCEEEITVSDQGYDDTNGRYEYIVGANFEECPFCHYRFEFQVTVEIEGVGEVLNEVC